jgi:hypothetical protein
MKFFKHTQGYTIWAFGSAMSLTTLRMSSNIKIDYYFKIPFTKWYINYCRLGNQFKSAN